MNIIKIVAASLVIFILILLILSSDAGVASHNLSKAADQFEINRRIVFYNGVTNDYIMVIEGLCSLGNEDNKGTLSVTCKTGTNQYKKHFLGLSDSVTYWAEQLDSASASAGQYRVIFKPSSLISAIDVR